MYSALPLINIYVCTKFNINPFCTFQDMDHTGMHYGKKWLRGDNYVNIQCVVMVLVHCSFPDCLLSINQVSYQSLLYFSRYGPDTQPLWQIQGAIYLYTKFDLNGNSSFKGILPGFGEHKKITLGQAYIFFDLLLSTWYKNKAKSCPLPFILTNLHI